MKRILCFTLFCCCFLFLFLSCDVPDDSALTSTVNSTDPMEKPADVTDLEKPADVTDLENPVNETPEVVCRHDFETETYAPTCTEAGHEIKKCTICGEEQRTDFPALEHDYHWTKNTIYDCTATEEDGICSHCGGCTTRSFSTIEHSYTRIENDEQYPYVAPKNTVEGSEYVRCTICSDTQKRSIDPLGEPKIAKMEIQGDLTKLGVSGNYQTVLITYTEGTGETLFTTYATVKLQGATSKYKPKKNYTVKFYTDDTLTTKKKYNLGWGKESKYCLKGNWIDTSQIRNIASTTLWGEAVDSRAESELQAQLAALKTNGGAVDGYPILLYNNGEFVGIYTLNVPKDEWMFDMKKSAITDQAVVSVQSWDATGTFETEITDFESKWNGDWFNQSDDSALRLIYNSRFNDGTETKEKCAWVVESLNRLIRVANADDATFLAEIEKYVDIDACIDYIIFLYVFACSDNASKNMLWATYDGVKWFPTVYDMDGVLGIEYGGTAYSNSLAYQIPYLENGEIQTGLTDVWNRSIKRGNVLWKRIMNLYGERFYARYVQLRYGALSCSNVEAVLTRIQYAIPESAWALEEEKWSEERKGSATRTDVSTIVEWYRTRMEKLDRVMKDLYDPT